MIEQKFLPKCVLGNYSECSTCPAYPNCNGEYYPCKYARYALASGENMSCQNYSFYSYRCTHGGAAMCLSWRNKTNREI